MNYMLLGKIPQSLIYVADYSFAVALFKSASGHHYLRLQVTFIANLRNNVTIIGGADNVVAAE
jgi:hypothetical protein